jgi:hypothetical protein
VGNVYERFKLSERACASLLDKLSQLKDPTTSFLDEKYFEKAREKSNFGEFFFLSNSN